MCFIESGNISDKLAHLFGTRGAYYTAKALQEGYLSHVELLLENRLCCCQMRRNHLPWTNFMRRALKNTLTIDAKWRFDSGNLYEVIDLMKTLPNYEEI